MKALKHIRVLVSIVMLIECVALVWLGAGAPLHARVAGAMQLSASKIAMGITASVGAWIVWLLATLLLGRVYCSSACPVGTLQDVVRRASCLIKPRPYRRRAASRTRWWVLAAYAAAVVAGVGIVPLLIDPWPSFVNGVEQSGHLAGPGLTHPLLVTRIGLGALWGVLASVASVALIAAWAVMRGRDFCNEVCPVGSILALAAERSMLHLELIPDRCTSCLRCEDVCKAGCIDIKTRTIDNARCVRCFNCLAECPDDAIKYQINRNGIITPMFQRKTSMT
ncbi:MAG: 4Fe-4S binding protein [Bacteroidales bacterium]|nr:4Fe-4S binding protein [Bacteroidales bacterium]